MNSFKTQDGSVLGIVTTILSLLPGLVAKEVNVAELTTTVTGAEVSLPLLATPQQRLSAALKAVIADQAKIFIDPAYSAYAVEFLTWIETLIGGTVSLSAILRG